MFILKVEGEEAIDINLIKLLREKNPALKIVPRLYLPASQDNIFQVLDMQDENNIYDILDFVKRIIR